MLESLLATLQIPARMDVQPINRKDLSFLCSYKCVSLGNQAETAFVRPQGFLFVGCTDLVTLFAINMAEKTEDVIVGIVVLVLIICVIFGLHPRFGGEHDGHINFNYYDCREVITVKPTDFKVWFKEFTCEYGGCDSVEFTNDGKCLKAYTYSKETK